MLAGDILLQNVKAPSRHQWVMLNSLTLLWKGLPPPFHCYRRLDRGKISRLPEAMHWLSIRDQIKLWHFLALSSVLWKFCLLKKLLKEKLKHIVPTLNTPPTLRSPIPLLLNAALPAPACRNLSVCGSVSSSSFSGQIFRMSTRVHCRPSLIIWANTQLEIFFSKRQGLHMSGSIDIFLNQAETRTATLNVVLENAAFCFHLGLLFLRNNLRKGRQWKTAGFVLRKEHVKQQH